MALFRNDVEIYAGSIINMRTGQVIPSRQLVEGAVVLGQEGARVGINGSNARVPLPIVDTVEDIVPLTQNTQGSIPLLADGSSGDNRRLSGEFQHYAFTRGGQL